MGNAQVQPPETAFCNLNDRDQEGLLLVQLYLLPAWFLSVFILGLPLNLLSLWIFLYRLKRWTRSTILIFNLTLADTSWLLALPFLVKFHLNQLYWTSGLPLCTAVRLLYHNYFYSSIFFVTSISLDRYLAIVHPLRSPTILGRRHTFLLCVLVWLVTLALSIPVADMTLIQTCPSNNHTICTLYLLLDVTSESLPYSLFCSIIGFFFPLVSICYCCLCSVRELRRRPGLHHPHGKWQRLMRVMRAVLVLFALLYLPYHLVRNAAIVMRALYPDSPASWGPSDLAFSLEMCLCSLNTCINPLFSCFVGRQFRREFHDSVVVLIRRCPRSKLAALLKREGTTVQQRQGVTTVSPL